MVKAYDADVAIVGYGPSGVIAATYLGMAGISTVVLEKDADLYNRARAVTVNDWTLRIFQEFGVAERVKEDMDPARGMTWKTYAGKTVFHLDVYPGELGQPPAMMIYQPEMEAVLRENCGSHSSLDLRFGHTMTGLSQDGDGVNLSATASDGSDYDLRVRYVIGADGGTSKVRDALGYTMVGNTRPRRWLVIDGAVLEPWPGHDELRLLVRPDVAGRGHPARQGQPPVGDPAERGGVGRRLLDRGPCLGAAQAARRHGEEREDQRLGVLQPPRSSARQVAVRSRGPDRRRRPPDAALGRAGHAVGHP